MTTFEIIQLCIICVIVLAFAVWFVIKAIKDKWLQKLWDTTKQSIKEAEENFPESGSGDKKKEYLIGKIKEKCKELGIPYKLIKKLIDLLIDTVIKGYNTIAK